MSFCLIARTIALVVNIVLCSYSDSADRKVKKNYFANKTRHTSQVSMMPIFSVLDPFDTTPRQKINLATVKSIKILTMRKEMLKGNERNTAYTKCESWSLSINQLKYVIRKFKQTSSESQNLVYSYMPCEISGRIMIDGEIFKYWINAGSTLILTNPQGEFYFACSDKVCNKYFITGKDLPEKK